MTADNTATPISICIISSASDPFSLCFLDVARYFRYHLSKAGLEVRSGISKNRLYNGHVNIVFGAHMASDLGMFRNYSCIFVNLEQLGSTGKKVAPAYLDLLSKSYRIDYDPSNSDALAVADQSKSCIATLGYAEYLAKQSTAIPLEERPIDILFYGAINEKRKAILQTVASSGTKITVVNGLFGPERDAIVAQSKLVLNISFYDKGTFEQVRIFQCLSLGTPVLSLLDQNTTNIPEAYQDSVFYTSPDYLAGFTTNYFKTDRFYEDARTKLDIFSHHNSFLGLEDILNLLYQAASDLPSYNPASAWRETPRINIGSGRKYMNGWLNIDINPDTSPDLVLDLAQPDLEFPIDANSETLGDFRLKEDSVDLIVADNVIEHIDNLTTFMTNCLRLLREKGRMVIIVPYHRSNTAWQDPTHVKAFNENSWIYYADWFWYLGWFAHRFSILSCEFLNMQEQVTTNQSDIHFMRVNLEKVQTTPAEKNIARLQRGDFGPLPFDD